MPSGLCRDVAEDLFQFLVGGSEPFFAEFQQFFASLGVVAQVIDTALRVLHFLDELLEFVDGLCVGHFFHDGCV